MIRLSPTFALFFLLLTGFLAAESPGAAALGLDGDGVRGAAHVAGPANGAYSRTADVTADVTAEMTADTADSAEKVVVSGMVYRQEYDALIPTPSSLVFRPARDSSGSGSGGTGAQEPGRVRAPDGMYRIRLAPGLYDVEITPARDTARVFRFAGVEVPAVDTMRDFRLEKVGEPEYGTRVFGIVSDSASGEPLAGASVLLAVERQVLARTKSDSAGGYSFAELRPDLPHFVQAQAEGYVPATRRVVLEAGKELDVLLALVKQVTGAVEGRVVSSEGAPLKGAAIHAIPVGGTRDKGAARTGEDGRWRLSLAAGEYVISALYAAADSGDHGPVIVKAFFDGAETFEEATPVRVAGDSIRSGIDFVLEITAAVDPDARHGMGGVVAGPDSAGVADALVLAFSKSAGLVSAFSDSAGRYGFEGLPEDVYHLLFVAEGFLPGFHPGTLDWMKAEAVELRGDRLDLRTVLRPLPEAAQRGAGQVKGFVKGADGSPLSGAAVALIDSDGVPVQGGMSGLAGGFRLSGLQAGSYKMQASRVGYRTWEESFVLEAAGGMDRSMDIVLEPAESATSAEAPGGEGSAERPGAFRLEPNTPNPFNPSTQLRFTLPEAGKVRLEVYDVNGRRVRVLLDEVRAAGSHTVAFEAGDLPSGLYVARLRSASGSASRLMTLIK